MFFNVGDLVSRSSHNNDLVFRVITIKNDIAILESINGLIVADSYLNDLRKEDKIE